MNHGPQRLQPRPGPIAVALLVLAGGAAAVHAGECAPGWDPVFGIPGINSGVVFDFATHDDGSGRGDELYASGSYNARRHGGVDANGIGRFNTCDTGDLPGDANGDGVVDTADLVALLSTRGDCPPEGECPGDFDGNGTVDFNDLLVILVNWS